MKKKEKREFKIIEKEQKKRLKINVEKLHKSYYFRDFEIEMYWKRAQYFWSFLAVIYAGYFLLITEPSKGFLNSISSPIDNSLQSFLNT